MSGFQVFNTAGALTVNSDYRSPMAVGTAATAMKIGATGDYNQATAFGNMSELGDLAQGDWIQANTLQWFKIPVGSWCFPGAWMFKAGASKMLTNNTQAVTSGYLNVYDAAGTLIWSAVSAARMPRVLGYLDVKPNVDLEGVTQTFNVPAGVFFAMNCFPGNLSYDGVEMGYNGIILKQVTATQVQIRWITRKQQTWAQTLKAVGIRIPYCVFPFL